MTGNDVAYSYGSHGTSNGRVTSIVDGSGRYTCAYDALGNVVKETRTIAVPSISQVFRFSMEYLYDSWGRMIYMVYPDEETVNYYYQWGGDLQSMTGDKFGDYRVYIKDINYNAFGQKSQVSYGNGTYTEYGYDELHRLAQLRSCDGGGTKMQDIQYTFDNVSNVTEIANYAGRVNTLGGSYKNFHKYDPLYRLTNSEGDGQAGHYVFSMKYTPSGRIMGRFKNVHSESQVEAADMAYGYCDEYQPHAVRRMYDYSKEMFVDFRWDKAGNMGQVAMADRNATFESGRFLFWTEDNRLHTVVDEKYYSYYAYDHSGERRLKLTGDTKLGDINADCLVAYPVLTDPTLYPSAYMVLNKKGYTKHYYAGAERVAARMGGGCMKNIARTDWKLQDTADVLFGQSNNQLFARVLNDNDLNCVMHNEFAIKEFDKHIDGMPNRVKTLVSFECKEFSGIAPRLEKCDKDFETKEVFFYHSDHLGSASWITDADGKAVQHLQYLPYGEPYVNQRISGYNERFTFTGKERDEETGYGYFGARYMDHELMTMWLSVDPMADKYPSISPYAYCNWNPVKLIDPDGREFSEVMDKYAKIIETICQRKINMLTELSKNGELTEQQQTDLKEFQSTLSEISAMRNDKTTFYDVQSGSFGPEYHTTKGATQYYGCGDILGKGKKPQHWIMVSLNTDRNLFLNDDDLNYEGVQTLTHELKHCYQFYNKEMVYIQPIDSKSFNPYKTESLEKAAFRRAAAFGALDRYKPNLYPDLFRGTIEDFIKENPGCQVVKHK